MEKQYLNHKNKYFIILIFRLTEMQKKADFSYIDIEIPHFSFLKM